MTTRRRDLVVEDDSNHGLLRATVARDDMLEMTRCRGPSWVDASPEAA